jgi:4'-phosphopantetheinyl transferase
VVGCDLEVVEPRSRAFVREWLAAPEQAFVAGLADDARDRTVNGLWTAKEAVAKVRREGLRLDVRHAVVEGEPPTRDWRPLRVRFEDGSTDGWWREEPGWVLAVAADPAPVRPRGLQAGAASTEEQTHVN